MVKSVFGKDIMMTNASKVHILLLSSQNKIVLTVHSKIKLWAKNLVQTPISQFKQKNTPFLLHKSTKWTKISIPSYKKIANPVYFFPEPPWSEWPWAA